MGSYDNLSESEKVEKTTVNISYDFYISKSEVTQADWSSVMEKNPSALKEDNFPVHNVSWYNAVEYCNRRSEKEGLMPAYNIEGKTVNWNNKANGYRLPTEAEWEYAAKNGNTTEHSYKYSGSNDIYEVAWFHKNSNYTIHHVATKKSNDIGLYDMSGNVAEWCWDYYAELNAEKLNNPEGPSWGEYRICRGGSYNQHSGYCETTKRDRYYPNSGTSYIGFRVVRNP